MSNLMYDILIFGICLEVVAYLTWAFNFFGGVIQYPFGSAQDMLNLSNAFSFTIWTYLISGTGAVIGIVALLLKQGTYALYALLVFAFGVFYKIIYPIVVAIPNLVAGMLPNSTNPNYTIVNGQIVYGLNPIQVVVGVIVGFAIFIFCLEFVLQRKVS
jgi:hypothetical protein